MNEQARIATPDGIELDFPLAGFSSRAIAGMLDLFLLLALWVAFVLAGLGFAGATELGGEGGALGLALGVLLMFVSYWGYGIFWEQIWRGQTPGKRLCGLRVIRDNGLPVGLKQSLLRNLLRVVDLQPGATYTVGLVSMLGDSRGRRLGDIVAGTIVVRDSLVELRASKSGALWAARAEEGKTQHAVRLAGGCLSAAQLSAVEQFLERRQSLDPARRGEIAGRIAASMRAFLSSEQLKTLDKDPERLLEEIQRLASAAQDEEPAVPTRAGQRSLFW